MILRRYSHCKNTQNIEATHDSVTFKISCTVPSANARTGNKSNALFPVLAYNGMLSAK